MNLKTEKTYKWDISALAERITVCVKRAGGRTVLAEKAGVSIGALDNYSFGRREPKISTIVSIANAASVKIEWLVGGEGQRDLFNDQSGGSSDVTLVDNKLLELVITMAEEHILKERIDVDPGKKYPLFMSMYRLALAARRDDPATGGGSNALDEEALRDILALANKN